MERVRGVVIALGVLLVGLGTGSPVAATADGTVTQMSGTFGPYTVAVPGVVIPNAGVTGEAQVEIEGSTASVAVEAAGLAPGSRHAVHVHFGSCGQLLGHFRYNPAGPGIRANEVWLDLTADQGGTAEDQVTVPSFNLNQALSIVIHLNANPDVVAGSKPGPRIACADLRADN